MKIKNALINVGGLLAILVLTIMPLNTQAQKPDIFTSVFIGDNDAVSEALDNGQDVNEQTSVGNTLLMVAARMGDQQILKTLMAHKADVNLQNDAGATALMIAAKYGHQHFTTELLKYGADPTIKTKRGYTAAIFAQGYKNWDIQSQLVEAEKNYKHTKKLVGVI